MGKLVLLFIIVPTVELALLIEVGGRLGTLPTAALVVVTGVVGAFAARMQGLGVVAEARAQVSRGEIPAGSLVDGVMILLAAALLVTPGLITDSVGFLLLIPAIRARVKAHLLERFKRAVEQNRVQVRIVGVGLGGSVHELDPREESDTGRWVH
ncbi:MAG TPA: FxsA family protein [Vicinamibacteria bacterium]|nr:FxsA family protein [Vicinamibacteria bacterium]